jgi:capsule polysaccharide export protein KpsC/LpsZ
MLQHANPDIHFYLRIHPNLKGVTHKAHMELYDLGKYPNITIIPPESKVSSYALMDACDKVVTFGSSTGVEASYWGKPSILVGRSFYEMTGACYHMKSRDELVSAINNDLPAKDQLGALKYAYFVLDRQYSVDESNFDIDVRYRHMRWDFFSTSYFKVHGSDFLFQLYYFFYCIIGPKFSKAKLNFPWPKR